jgi:hypothetical protein
MLRDVGSFADCSTLETGLNLCDVTQKLTQYTPGPPRPLETNIV